MVLIDLIFIIRKFVSLLVRLYSKSLCYQRPLILCTHKSVILNTIVYLTITVGKKAWSLIFFWLYNTWHPNKKYKNKKQLQTRSPNIVPHQFVLNKGIQLLSKGSLKYCTALYAIKSIDVSENRKAIYEHIHTIDDAPLNLTRGKNISKAPCQSEKAATQPVTYIRRVNRAYAFHHSARPSKANICLQSGKPTLNTFTHTHIGSSCYYCTLLLYVCLYACVWVFVAGSIFGSPSNLKAGISTTKATINTKHRDNVTTELFLRFHCFAECSPQIK